jgi:carboxymethylenebutenolidase
MMIEFSAGRRRARAYLAVPDGGDVPGIMVLHAWWGLNPFAKRVCNRLADAGFVGFAPDLYSGKTASTINEAKRLRSKMDNAIVRKQLNGAVDRLRDIFATSGDKIGVIGFSLGAYWALWLANERPHEVKAVVPFYGTRKGVYKHARAAFQGHFAQNDEWEPIESVRQLEKQLRSDGREVKFYTYRGTKHWFFEENRTAAYDAKAAQLAWKRTLSFLRRELN